MTLREFLLQVAMLSVSVPVVLKAVNQPQMPPRKTKFIPGDLVQIGPRSLRVHGTFSSWRDEIGKRGYIESACHDNISRGTTGIYAVTGIGAWFSDNELEMIKPCAPAVHEVIKHFRRY